MKKRHINLLVAALFLAPHFAVEATAAAPARPNVLFCIADDAGLHFGAYGCSWAKTPNIDRLAKQGLVFANAYTPTAKCAPSRAAIMTGRNPWQLEEAANHLPLILRWPAGITNPGRKVADFISFIDFAPTFLELLGVDGMKSGMSPITGRSFHDLLVGKRERERNFAILGRERNDVRARPGTEADLGYPIRAIREGDLFYIHNFAPDRWPCGNVELGLLDTDKGPTKKFIEDLGEKDPYWQLAFGKRPQEELFDLATDPDCLKNLADDPARRAKMAALKETLFTQLKAQNDPRVLGRGDVFDQYSSPRVTSTDEGPKRKAKKKAQP